MRILKPSETLGPLMSDVKVQHSDCVCCQAKVLKPAPEAATLILLRMLFHDDLTPEDLYENLCFYHRRQLEREE